jgi:serpin B
MPRFAIETRVALKDVLGAIGVPLAFDPSRADLTGIHVPAPGEGRPYISAVIHQANIDVDEKGTEAAAATAVGVDTGGGPSPLDEITLRLDRPFLFVLRDVQTGAVLFMGRVVDPSLKRGD